ncbi:MAG: winged helix-turn-helix domain-containing protein [Actinomycetota bacterium]|nr:winged helix-turn-helix domain-containing protein [Actinomycetota bacterium]
MDDERQQAFQIALEEAMRERVKIDATIEFLSSRLGSRASLVLTAGSDDGLGTHVEPQSVGPIPVAPGEFHATSSSQAARIILERSGRSRPLKTDELFTLIARGGVRLSGKHAKTTFYRTLNNDHTFERVAPSTWGLREWYAGGRRPTRSRNGQPDTGQRAEDESPVEGVGEAERAAEEQEQTM